jgi:magnesium chelatase family protein
MQRQGVPNARLGPADIDRFCLPDASGESLLRNAIGKLGLSARAYHRIRKVARTIADLAGEPDIRTVHIAEAVQYRRLGFE